MLPLVIRLDEASAARDTTSSFDGRVRIQKLVSGDQSRELELLAVYFDAGARTIPHIHEKDQVLHFVAGQGIVATDKEKRVCSAGDVVTIPGGTWHWHGATRDQAMCHVSIRQPGGTDWAVERRNWAEY
jgi:quercetin dioxygenase-like cupin family protein